MTDCIKYFYPARKCGKTLLLIEQMLKDIEEGRQIIVYENHEIWRTSDTSQGDPAKMLGLLLR